MVRRGLAAAFAAGCRSHGCVPTDAATISLGAGLRYADPVMAHDNRTIWISVAIVVVLAAGVAGYWLLEQRARTPVEPPAVVQPPSGPVEPEPEPVRHPVETIEAEPARNEAPPELPTIENRNDDATVRALADALGDGKLLRDVGLVDAFVAMVDALPGRRLPDRVRPWLPPPGSFEPTAGPEADRYRFNAANAARYRAYVDAVVSFDTAAVAETYRDNYAVLEAAWRDLGNADDYLNDRVVEVLDHLLGTPVGETMPVLTRPNVLYEYDDPALEALSVGQKMLLRLEPDQANELLGWLGELRARLATGAGEANGGVP